MSRTLHYYNVFITKNGVKTNIYISELLDRIMGIDWLNKLRMVNGHPVVMFGMNIPNNNSIDRIISIGQYRKDIKPYIGDMAIEKAELINEDIIEMITCYFVPNSRTAIIEYNMYGAKVKDICDYLNSFLPSNDNEKWKVEFIPIDSERSIRDIKASHEIKKIELKLNLHSGLIDRLISNGEDVNEETKSLFATILTSAKEMSDKLNTDVLTINFGTGRKKGETNPDEILGLIELLDIESEVIQSVKVRYRNNSTGKLEDLDLKYVGILKDTIMENDDSTGWEFVGDKIVENYASKNRPASTVWSNRGFRFIDDRLPDVITEPTEEYRVDVEEGERDDDIENAS